MGDRASADSLRWNLDLVLDQRGADMADIPVGASGLLCRDYKAKEADRLVTRIDPGVVLMVAELRGHNRRVAEDLGQRKTRVEERKPLDASPAAVTLALLLTDQELNSLEERGWSWRNRGARTNRWIRCRKPSTGCAPW